MEWYVAPSPHARGSSNYNNSSGLLTRGTHTGSKNYCRTRYCVPVLLFKHPGVYSKQQQYNSAARRKVAPLAPLHPPKTRTHPLAPLCFGTNLAHDRRTVAKRCILHHP